MGYRPIKNIDQLITEGAYSVIRHPLYAADIILGWSVFILDPLYKIMAIVIWLMVVLIFWANLEERLLEEKFLEDYRNYKKRVPMLVPNVWKRKV
jgi:protein-S-isoprenylcysteine O-methyltransferase Ste14